MTPHSYWKKDITLFLSAQTISLFGSSIVQYAIIWYITLTTSSGLMITLSTLCGFLPQLIISLFAGVWVDRYNRKYVSMISDAVIAVVTLLLAISFILGYKPLWLIFAVLAVRSFGTGIQTPTVNSIIPQLVPKEHLIRVNGINSTLSSLNMLIAPATSGVLYAYLSIEKIFFVDVITAAIALTLMSMLKLARLSSQNLEGKSTIKAIREGFYYLKENPFIRYLIIFLIVMMILISPAAFMTPLMVSRSFGPEAWRLAINEMAFSSGAIVGGIAIAMWGGFNSRLRTTLLAGGAYGFCMIALGCAPVFAIYLAFNFLIGITMPCFNAPITALLQEKVDPVMHGRIFSLVQVANCCALPLGMVLFGPLADHFRIEHLLVMAGILVLLLCAQLFVKRKLME
ncbi:macrolide-efflux protein [Hafnia paralvei ATCC 29927]|uniref:MFS transporter n=1 Tax=Hafnia paralvei TaxID=546367 RepID=UPI0007E4A50D|nr:MFS transporter [Hafnia paralvei]MDU1190565.1 MFS transporter [Enterobacteriaceae bacterium]MDU1243414.1 MFS transporter [Enterobacteriaceae bacterium]OAT40396.1 macrolide-efflux protein [Hafnia paralvei ATCC 29927]HCU16724.1 MFS transporter [Hafnia paralvei]